MCGAAWLADAVLDRAWAGESGTLICSRRCSPRKALLRLLPIVTGLLILLLWILRILLLLWILLLLRVLGVLGVTLLWVATLLWHAVLGHTLRRNAWLRHARVAGLRLLNAGEVALRLRLLLIALAERLAAGCASGAELRVWLICGGKGRGRGRLLAGLTLGRAAWRRGCRGTAKAAGCASKAS
jgi:hypothetical protein